MANVTNEAELQACKDDATADYTVTQNITLTADFTSYMISNYTGTFDGGNYNIDSLTLTPSGHYAGLFSSVGSAGTVQNVKLTNLDVNVGSTTRYYIGGLCGDLNGGTIDNCHVVSGSVYNASYYTGVLIGIGYGTITDCSNAGTFTRYTTHVSGGGIIGRVDSTTTMTRCYNTANISTVGTRTAGVVGDHSSGTLTMNSCYNTGNISVAQNTAGVIGYTPSTILVIMDSCYNTGTINGTVDIGGVAGNARATMTDCYNTGSVTGTNYRSAGLIGYSYGTSNYTRCYNTGDVTANYQIGGLIGLGATTCNCTDCYVDNCTITTSSNGTSGAFIGLCNSNGTHSGCYVTNTVTIIGTGPGLGGYVGQGSGSTSFTNCYSEATMTFNSTLTENSGGFMGNIVAGSPTFTDCYTTMDVGYSGSSYPRYRAGGFVGNVTPTTASFVRCYSTGDVRTSSQQAGGFVGLGNGSYTDCYSEATTVYTGTSGNAGGFVGILTNNADFTSCYTLAENVYIAGNGNSIGGFMGAKGNGTVTISKCYTNANVYGTGSQDDYLAGFIGRATGSGTITIDNCYCTGDVGLSGYSGGARYRSGGFIGYVSTGTVNIRRCYSTGNVKAYGLDIGGFVGWLQSGTTNIDDSYSTGAISGSVSTDVGQFAGDVTGTYTFTNCGCYDDSSGLNAIGSTGGSVTYEKTDPTEWYDATENVYDTGTYTWDFSSVPVWYEWSTDYPKFTAEPSVATDNSIFFGCHF